MMVQKMKKKKIGGFTLIELIVVIAILGILAVIAIPRFTGMRENANQSAISSNLTNIQKAAEMVAAEQNKKLADLPEDTGTGDIAKALGNWPKGPGNVTYSFKSGDAIAANVGDLPLPTPPKLKYSDLVSP
jgi:prepilin-type N-terminal cleavage/methylation domain-containing protein